MTSMRNMKPILEQIEEMKVKLKLLDGDTKAYYEASYRYLQEAKEKIYTLRNETRELRKDLLDRTNTTEFIMDQAFQKTKENFTKMANRSTSQVVAEMDYEVSRKLNQLNSLRHQTKLKAEKATSIDAEVRAIKERMDETSSSNSEHQLIQEIRNLENKLDKAAMKSSETVHIGRTYQAIKEKLLEEQSTYATTVEALESEIRRCSEKLFEMKTVSEDAIALREQAKDELRRHEEVMYAHRKRRELELVNMRRTLDLRKEEMVPVKTLILDDDLGKSEPDVNQEANEDLTETANQHILASLEKVYEQLKMVTGSAKLVGIEKRFEEIDNSMYRLHVLRTEAEEKIFSLQEQKEKLKVAFLDLRSASDARLKETSVLERAQSSLGEAEKDLTSLINNLSQSKIIETLVRMAIEHIFLKLYTLKASNRKSRKQSFYLMKHLSEMNIVDILHQCLELQGQLEADLEEYSIEDKLREMQAEKQNSLLSMDEHQHRIEAKVHADNMRIKPQWMTSTRSVEEDDPDHPDYRSRNDVKNQSAYIVSVNKRAKAGKN